jgi:hypothetical protein
MIGWSDELTVSLDTSRVVVDSGGMRVWLRFDYSTPQPVPREGDTAHGDMFTRVEIEEYLDCHGQRARDVEISLFDSTHVCLARFTSDTASWVSLTAHPLNEKYFNLACGGLQQYGLLPSAA